MNYTTNQKKCLSVWKALDPALTKGDLEELLRQVKRIAAHYALPSDVVYARYAKEKLFPSKWWLTSVSAPIQWSALDNLHTEH